MKKGLAASAIMVASLALAYSVPSHVSAPLGEVFTTDTPVRVLFVGDLMLDRNVSRTIAAEGPDVLFAGSKELFAAADLRVGNLEGTITTNPSIAKRDNKQLKFTFDPLQAQSVLQPLRFDAVSLANNHALDFGEFGFDETKERLLQLGVRSFGSPFNDSSTISTSVDAKGKTFCFVGYHSLYVATTTAVLSEIARIRPNCFKVVVFAHWGEEYQTHSNTAQREAAYSFIDAGADVVIGAHPHVVQEAEIYKDKAIFYSLGNFMFDQNFSVETVRGLAVRIDFYANKTSFALTPVTIRDQHSEVAEGPEREAILSRFGGLAEFTLP